ncbi:MAG: hypothetical protein M3467_02175, partial [Actinomycetota bacterium]|nr:hypothetical protein [Actinomycetota bacterium]
MPAVGVTDGVGVGGGGGAVKVLAAGVRPDRPAVTGSACSSAPREQAVRTATSGSARRTPGRRCDATAPGMPATFLRGTKR